MIGFAIATVLLTTSVEPQTAQDANSKFDNLYNQLTTQSTETPTPYGLLLLEQREANTNAFGFNSIGRLANYLADDYSLYSKIQDEVIRDRCKSEGLNIDPYLEKLAENSSQDVAVKNAIYARLAINSESTWQQVKLQSIHVFPQIIERFSAELNVPANNLCMQLANDPSSSASKLSYSSIRASRSQILRSISP